MNKQMAISLKETAQTTAKRFSSSERSRNANGETFTVEEVIPLSETTAVAFFLKNTGKKAIAFFYWVNIEEGKWYYFFPTESHIVGMNKLSAYLDKVDRFNFPLNMPSDIIF